MKKFFERLATKNPCGCAACRELRRRDAVEYDRLLHPWRSSLEDTLTFGWWLVRASAWTLWTVTLADAVLRYRLNF